VLLAAAILSDFGQSVDLPFGTVRIIRGALFLVSLAMFSR
jgi:hypothetical protein